MPVTINRTLSIKDKDGNISILTETDQIAESTDISAKCDSSRCASRHAGKPVEIAWNIEEVKEKPDALPDSFFRLLSLVINPRSQEQKVFCSAGCVRDFLQYDYVAPLSPREEAVLQATNQQAELAKHRPKTNVIQFPTKPAVEVVAPPVSADTLTDIIDQPVVPGPEGVEEPIAEPVSITDEPEKQGLEHPYRLEHDPNLGPFFESREGA